MVGSGRAAARAVVKEHEVGDFPSHLVEPVNHVLEPLRRVAAQGYGEMSGEYGEGIYEQLETPLERVTDLLFRAVVVAEKARAFLQMPLVDFGGGGTHAARVKLHGERIVVGLETARLDILTQIVEAFRHFGPRLHLTVEKGMHVVGRGFGVPKRHEGAAGTQLDGAQAVFIDIVAVHLFHGKGGVGIALPAAAEVEFVVDAPDAPAARYGQTEGIVFAVTGIGETKAAQNVGAEGTRRAQAVDAQGIVSPVVGRPFFMVDQARRQRFEVEVDHSVTANHHGRLLLAEGLDDAGERVRAAVKVVAVELHGVASAGSGAHGQVPAAADAQIGALGHEMHDAGIAFAQFFKNIRCAVGGMIVHHDDIKLKGRLLAQCALHGVADGTGAVADGYYHGRFCGIVGAVVREVVELIGGKPRADGFEVVRAYAFHFELHFSLRGIYVVELLFTAGAEVGLLLRIEGLGDMEKFSLSAQEEAQGIEGGKAEAARVVAFGIFLQQVCAHEPQAAEVEIVAQAAFLIVYDGVCALSVAAVGINHRRARIFRRLNKALDAAIAGHELLGREEKHGVTAAALRDYGAQ